MAICFENVCSLFCIKTYRKPLTVLVCVRMQLEASLHSLKCAFFNRDFRPDAAFWTTNHVHGCVHVRSPSVPLEMLQSDHVHREGKRVRARQQVTRRCIYICFKCACSYRHHTTPLLSSPQLTSLQTLPPFLTPYYTIPYSCASLHQNSRFSACRNPAHRVCEM